MPVVVVVVGGRHLGPDKACPVQEALSAAIEPALELAEARDGELCVVTGTETGADQHTAAWCVVVGIPLEQVDLSSVPGPQRNRALLDATTPDLVILLPGCGAVRDMALACKERDIPALRAPLP